MRYQNRRCEDCGEFFTVKLAWASMPAVRTNGQWSCDDCLKKKTAEPVRSVVLETTPRILGLHWNIRKSPK